MYKKVPNSENTYRQSLEYIWKVSGVQPEELKNHDKTPPNFPWIWEWFIDFPPPIKWPDIVAWSSLSQIVPCRWEGEILIRLDSLRK